jgi:DNA-binding SARP family transcriptional activator
MSVIYYQKIKYCSKPSCRKCRQGIGHGPYWYAYQTEGGRTTRTYVGKELPANTSPEGDVLESPQARLRVQLLGPLRVERRFSRDAWQQVPELVGDAQHLLAYLLAQPGRTAPRAQICQELWPLIPQADARLQRAAIALGQIITPARKSKSVSLLQSQDRITLASQSRIWIDTDAFHALLERLDALEAGADEALRERLLKQAADLYRGDFLSEEREAAWAVAPRQALRRTWTRILLELADVYIAQEASASALDVLDRLLARDPANEAATQRLIIVLARLKRRGEALRAYHRLADVLYRAYHSIPSAETRALYEIVRQGGALTREAITASPLQETSNEPPATMPVEIGRVHQSQLVGRESELEALHMLLFEAGQYVRSQLVGREAVLPFSTERRAQCALLTGEVGIGKTRLAEEIGRSAQRRGWTVAWGRAYAQESSIPYRLWTEVLRQALSCGAWLREAIMRRAPTFAPLVSILPELRGLLPESVSQLVPEQEQLRLWEAAHELLLLIAEGMPLLLVLDDLHWADSSSCELLAYLARRVHGRPIVIVGTCREHELPANHPLRPLLTDLQRERAVESIALQPLSDEQIDTLVSYMPNLPERIIERIRERAAGNPFFAEELARSVRAQIIAAGSLDSVDLDATLPETISAVLDLRMERLSSACQQLLAKAAVLGGSFSFQVINEMEAITPASNEDIVLELLEEALQAGVLTEEGVGTRITYQFWHPLLVSHLYERLSAARRASLHRRAADILRRANLRPEEEQEHAATITHHLVHGGADDALIVHYAELAGDHAYRLSSYPDAERHYQIALAHLPDRLQEQSHRAYLLECLGECTRVQGKYEEARHFFQQALEQSHPSLIADPLQEAQIQALLWCEIGWTWYDAGDMTKARSYCERSEQILQQAGVPSSAVWARVRFTESYVCWREGNYEKARIAARDALGLFEKSFKWTGNSIHLSTRMKRLLAGDPVDLGRTHVLLAIIANSFGQNTEALAHLNIALQLYEQYECLRELAIVCCDLGDTHMRRAEYSQAQIFLRRSLSVAERIGDMPIVSFVFGNLGWLDSRCGNLVEAEAELNRSIALAEQINDSMGLGMWYSCLATALLDQGKLAEAETALRRAFTSARTQRNTPYIGMALVALGHLRIAQAEAVQMSEEPEAQRKERRAHILFRARRALSRAVALSEIEAETRIEAQAALSEAAYLSGALDEAHEQAQLAFREAQRCKLIWLEARAERILAAILAARGEREQAQRYFARALHISQQCGMRLEYARTLLQQTRTILHPDGIKRDEARRKASLSEALHIFHECQAALDAQVAHYAIGHH